MGAPLPAAVAQNRAPDGVARRGRQARVGRRMTTREPHRRASELIGALRRPGPAEDLDAQDGGRAGVSEPCRPTWQTHVREPSLTALLACLLLLTFVITPLLGLAVIGQLAAGVIWT